MGGSSEETREISFGKPFLLTKRNAYKQGENACQNEIFDSGFNES